MELFFKLYFYLRPAAESCVVSWSLSCQSGELGGVQKSLEMFCPSRLFNKQSGS